jgi:adenine phosphoribosyltransferase/phosphomevalonate kinase
MGPKLIVLVTGEYGAGKDHCAEVWVSVFTSSTHNLTARTASISDAIKTEYADATGADINRLLRDRAYKEQHRPALTAYFQDQLRQRPRLAEEQLLSVVQSAVDVDVLLITGMRDEAPVATFSHLVPGSRMLEVRVQASKETRQVRRGCHGEDEGDDKESNKSGSNLKVSDYRPCLVFDNHAVGNEAAEGFAERYLLPFFSEDVQRLSGMVRPMIPDFPRPGIGFRHILDIAQQPGGLALCTTLLQGRFTGNWAQIGAVVCCEAGGFVFASALAMQVNVPLALIREAGKLPPPTVSVVKPQSHISSSSSAISRTDSTESEKRIEMERDIIPKGASVVVVDDVLATGRTLCAVLRLLDEAGICAEDVSIMVVAEFPVHRGRDLLRRSGFGRASIQSLLVFGGV